MDAIRRELSSETPELIAERDARSVVRAVVDLLKKGMNEQVHPVSIILLFHARTGLIDTQHLFIYLNYFLILSTGLRSVLVYLERFAYNIHSKAVSARLHFSILICHINY